MKTYCSLVRRTYHHNRPCDCTLMKHLCTSSHWHSEIDPDDRRDLCILLRLVHCDNPSSRRSVSLWAHKVRSSVRHQMVVNRQAHCRTHPLADTSDKLSSTAWWNVVGQFEVECSSSVASRNIVNVNIVSNMRKNK